MINISKARDPRWTEKVRRSGGLGTIELAKMQELALSAKRYASDAIAARNVRVANAYARVVTAVKNDRKPQTVARLEREARRVQRECNESVSFYRDAFEGLMNGARRIIRRLRLQTLS